MRFSLRNIDVCLGQFSRVEVLKNHLVILPTFLSVCLAPRRHVMIGFEFELPDFKYQWRTILGSSNQLFHPDIHEVTDAALVVGENGEKRYVALDGHPYIRIIYEDTEKIPFMRIVPAGRKPEESGGATDWCITFTADTDAKVEIVAGPYPIDNYALIKKQMDILWSIVRHLHESTRNNAAITLAALQQYVNNYDKREKKGGVWEVECQISYDCAKGQQDSGKFCGGKITDYLPQTYEKFTIKRFACTALENCVKEKWKNESDTNQNVICNNLIVYSPQVTVTWPLANIDNLCKMHYAKLRELKENKTPKKGDKGKPPYLPKEEDEGKLYTELQKKLKEKIGGNKVSEGCLLKIQGLLRLIVLCVCSAKRYSDTEEEKRPMLKDFTPLLWKSEFRTLISACFSNTELEEIKKTLGGGKDEAYPYFGTEIIEEIIKALGAKKGDKLFPGGISEIHEKCPTIDQIVESALNGTAEDGTAKRGPETDCTARTKKFRGSRENPSLEAFDVYQFDLNWHLYNKKDLEYWTPIPPARIYKENTGKVGYGPVLEIRYAGINNQMVVCGANWQVYTPGVPSANPFAMYATEYLSWFEKIKSDNRPCQMFTGH
jgi:hypothetical protein